MTASLPKPYLSREEANERLKVLGLEFRDTEHGPILNPGQEKQLQALIDLLGAAIAEWADVKDDFDEESPERIDAELQEWAEEYLVG